MRPQTHVSVANRGPILTKSMFSGYDACINPYVGCEFGCTYCYVRFFVKDDRAAAKEGRDSRPWGEFVRVRAHLEDKLPKELNRGTINMGPGRQLAVPDARLVIGTMTDPYQPAERRFRITRKALEILTDGRYPGFRKVGIFTRSPIVLDDLDLIAKLPRARVHFTVTPFPPEVLRAIEPISPRVERRWRLLQQIKDAGIRLHVNVSPVMPLVSDHQVEEFCQRLAEIGPAEFFVDPMQPYKESFESFETAMQGDSRWPRIREIMTDRQEYSDWKAMYRQLWERHWTQYGLPKSPETLPIWSDHEFRVWVDMRTGAQMSKRCYGDEV